jgi:hypothetical protein
MKGQPFRGCCATEGDCWKGETLEIPDFSDTFVYIQPEALFPRHSVHGCAQTSPVRSWRNTESSHATLAYRHQRTSSTLRPGFGCPRHECPGPLSPRPGLQEVASALLGMSKDEVYAEDIRSSDQTARVVGPKRATAREPDTALAALKAGKISHTRDSDTPGARWTT